MENQVNVENQIIQQVGQNSINQQFRWKNVFILLAISIVVIAVISFLYIFAFPPISCLIKGDKWGRAGTRGYLCIHTYSDGGKTCKSSDDCEGNCLAIWEGTPADYCQYDNNYFGCYSKIEECRIVNGKRECQGICVD